MKIAACSIFFNPVQTHVENLLSFIEDVDLVVIIDNSLGSNKQLLQPLLAKYSNMVYIPLGKNFGIAKALNMACHHAFQNDYDYILTMDQDSFFKRGELIKLIDEMRSLLTNDRQLAIVSPFHQTNVSHLQSIANCTRKKVPQCITSGNLLKLAAWHHVGGFKEEYFIDYVDYEFCMRLRKYGYSIYTTYKAFLNHQLGDVRSYRLFGKVFTATNHSALRRYYMTRNRIDAFWKYLFFDPKTCVKELYYIPAEFLKMVFFEENKLVKVKAFFYGIHDFILANFGPAKNKL